MMLQLLSWGLTVSTVATMYLLAEKKRVGFLVGIAAQPVWIAVDVMTGAYGLIPLAVVIAGLYARGWWKWGQS